MSITRFALVLFVFVFGLDSASAQPMNLLDFLSPSLQMPRPPAPIPQPAAYPRHETSSVVIDTARRTLTHFRSDGSVKPYSIGVGRVGFQWKGTRYVDRKVEWPSWSPPPEMIARQPYLPRWMAGGENNPLGARALYLGGTLYRIHGTNDLDSIGKAVSSGCFRMKNSDVIELYDHVGIGTKVIVR